MPAITYSSVDYLTLNCGSGGDFILVTGTAAGTSLFVHGNGGNDRLEVDDNTSGTAFAGTSFLYGDAGTDSAYFQVDGASTNATLTSTGMSVNGGAIQSYSAESITPSFGAAGFNLNIKSMSTACQVYFGNGNDNLTIGDGNFEANNTRNIAVGFGISFGDSVTYDDHLDTGNDGYLIQPGDILFKQLAGGGNSAQVDVNFFSGGTQTLLANNDDNAITCGSPPSDLGIFANGGNDVVYVDGGNVSVNTADELTTGMGDQLYVDNPAGAPLVKIVGSDHVGVVQFVNAGTLQVPTGATLDVTGALSYPNGTIDLAGGSMIVRSATGLSQSTVRALVSRGYANGAWNGTSFAGAINSSLANGSSLSDAVGYGLGSALAVNTVGGFSINPADTLIRYTLNGDANLDQKVDTIDFNILAANFAQSGRVWSQADFNYTSSVDSIDFNLLASQFSKSLAASGGVAAATLAARVVPTATPLGAVASFFSDRAIDRDAQFSDVLASLSAE